MTVATALLRPFEDLRREDVDYAGGKGANLGEMTAAGLPVPPGFVVGAASYALFCDGGGLRDRIEKQLSAVDVDDTEALERATLAVREMIENEPVPEEISSEIHAAYDKLSGGEDTPPVAVRSSATAEDTEAASFAGMNETFLNIRGGDAVLDAVRRCWASLFGARTVFYRAKRGFPLAGMDIAVVVQLQIQSRKAGVMFTIDPSSGSLDQIVVEGAFGLGESVVSGQVSPDRYVVDKESDEILVHDVKRKELEITSLPGGGTETTELPPERARQPVLDDGQISTLAGLARQIEGHYGTPQDTEWAVDDDEKIWMLQSRPVTTLSGPLEEEHEVLVRGLGAAPGIGGGRARVITEATDSAALEPGEVLVTHMTAPDWVPLMRRAAAIVTDSGGMTCHA
ncbi:MAG: PEP/pyruvate-binding domain-containing protein, partial [Solirubrobacterales bacterium]